MGADVSEKNVDWHKGQPVAYSDVFQTLLAVACGPLLEHAILAPREDVIRHLQCRLNPSFFAQPLDIGIDISEQFIDHDETAVGNVDFQATPHDRQYRGFHPFRIAHGLWLQSGSRLMGHRCRSVIRSIPIPVYVFLFVPVALGRNRVLRHLIMNQKRKQIFAEIDKWGTIQVCLSCRDVRYCLQCIYGISRTPMSMSLERRIRPPIATCLHLGITLL